MRSRAPPALHRSLRGAPAKRARGAQSQATAPTPSQPEGPFYPKTFPADRGLRSDADRRARRPRRLGTPLYFSGRVLARDGRPVADAAVELWQCDVHGRYHHAGDDGVPRDDNFQGYGVATTDARGSLRLQDDPAGALRGAAAAPARQGAPAGRRAR